MAKRKEISADLIKSNPLPRHIAVIMDGNGRWAQKRLLPRSMGHRAGMASLKELVKATDELTIPYLTVFAFSTENWKRPVTEVDFLMNLLVEFLQKELDELHQNHVRIRVMGDYSVIPGECQAEIKTAIEKTRNNKGLVFNIAINYGARQEIITAVKQFAHKLMAHEITIDDLNEEAFSSWLYTGDMPDPDLLVRTAGEKRISNFMLWQIAYAEIVISETLWPDFSRDDLFRAIKEYQNRDRRFGGLSRGQAE
ncbi:MAG: isoprenyl transferase [Syntrophomonadaceae bacterium]|nr:isoprenyl transferase [Syntrophomonadaceae bacterium]